MAGAQACGFSLCGLLRERRAARVWPCTRTLCGASVPRARTSLGGTSTAQHGRLLHCLENSLVSLAFVGSDGEVWLSESHGPQVGLSHRVSALGGIAQAVRAAGQREQSSVRFSQSPGERLQLRPLQILLLPVTERVTDLAVLLSCLKV